MTKVFKTVGDVQKQGIAFGEAWIFEGFPEPITEKDDPEKWEKEWVKAEDTFAKIEAAVAKFVGDAQVDDGRHRRAIDAEWFASRGGDRNRTVRTSRHDREPVVAGRAHSPQNRPRR